MELSYVKKVIRLLENSDVDEVEIEEEGKKIRVARHRTNSVQYQVPSIPQFVQQPPVVSTSPPIESKQVEEIPQQPKISYHEVKSPIVGTFYRATAGAAPASMSALTCMAFRKSCCPTYIYLGGRCWKWAPPQKITYNCR